MIAEIRPLLAVLVGAVLSLASVAAAAHWHDMNLWWHGDKAVWNTQYNMNAHHPEMHATDDHGRSGCVAIADTQASPTHGPILCDTREHIHRYTNVNYNYGYASAHIESSQTGLAHHHHYPH